MQYFAHPVDGIVREVVQIPDGEALENCCAPDFAGQLVACTVAVQQGWTYNGKKFAAPVAPAPTAEQLLAYAGAKQWGLVTGGYTATIQGAAVLFATDDTSLNFIDATDRLFDKAGAPDAVNWQTASGFVNIAKADFQTASLNIGLFIQACFNTLKAAEEGILGGTIAAFADIDALPWPSSVQAPA